MKKNAPEELADRLEEQRNNEEAVQQRLAFGLARISPASAFSLAATSLSGSSLALKQHYLEEAKRYRDVYARFQKEKSGGELFAIRISPNEPKPEPIDPRELPAFQYLQPPLKEVIRSSVLDLGILAVFNVVFFAGAFVAFLRYDVR